MPAAIWPLVRQQFQFRAEAQKFVRIVYSCRSGEGGLHDLHDLHDYFIPQTFSLPCAAVAEQQAIQRSRGRLWPAGAV